MTLGNRMISQTVRPKVRLLDSVRETIRRKHYRRRARKPLKSTGLRVEPSSNSEGNGRPEIERFLNHLAVEKRAAAAAQNQPQILVSFRERSR